MVATTALSGSRFRGWVWALLLVTFTFTFIIVVTSFSMRQIGPPYRRGSGGGSGRSGLGGHVQGDAEPANTVTAYQWRTLLISSCRCRR